MRWARSGRRFEHAPGRLNRRPGCISFRLCRIKRHKHCVRSWTTFPFPGRGRSATASTEPVTKMADDALGQLLKVTKGLEYPSESDAPFDGFRWAANPGASAAQAVAIRSAGERIEEVPVDRFFAE